MFPKNLNSIEEDISKKRLEETKRELSDHSKKRFLGQVTNTLIAGIVVIIVFSLFLWIIGAFR